MAVYNIFASADATIYSRYPLKNTGRDPILEVSVKNSQDGTRFLYRNPITENPYYTYDLAANGNYSTSDAYFPNTDIRRSVLQFSDQDINKLKVYASQAKSGSYAASLKLFLASAQNLNTTYSLDVFPISQSWCMGTGQFAQVPQSVNGVSWMYTCLSGSSPAWVEDTFYWNNIDLPSWESASYNWEYVPTAGQPYYVGSGGSWYDNIEATQSFDYMSNKDINTDITDIMTEWLSGSIPNYGVIVKHPQAVEENPNAFIDLKFFSVDTHTIYPPCLEIRWNDFVYNTGSLSVISNDLFIPSLGNNKGEFQQDSVQRFRINVRDKFPARVFQTSSVYLNNKALPSTSYWSIKDLDSEEIVVDYDTTYTKISCDTSGSYFDIYMNGLEPERYYKLLFKTVLTNSEIVVSDNNYYFKVIR